MNKFDRNYSLTIQSNSGGNVEITLPFTIEFDIVRNTLASTNTCSLRVYNLSKINREKLAHNSYDTGLLRAIELKAGYGEDISTIFSGNITRCFSVREGTNFVTTVECFGAGFAFVNGTFNNPFAAGTTRYDMLGKMMETLSPLGVSKGTISASFLDETLSRGGSLSGNTCKLLNEMSNNCFFIDNGKAHAILNNEYFNNPSFTLIDSTTGLLGTPRREETFLVVDVLFEPRVILGQKITLRTDGGVDGFNGDFKVAAVKHRGTISGAVCGSATTTIDLFYSGGALKLVS